MGIGIYMQCNYLNGALGALNGDAIAWQNNKRNALLNLFVWILLIVAVLMINYISKSFLAKVIKYGSLFLVAMQIVALISLCLSTNVFNETKKGHISRENMWQMGSKNNIVVFVLDTLDENYFEEARHRDRSFTDDLDGFTYFSNNLGIYGNTYPAITYLLTGDKYNFEKTYDEYKEEAFSHAEFLNLLKENGYKNYVYTEIESMSFEAEGLIDNYRRSDANLSTLGVIKGIYNLEAYRSMPIVMKPFFWMYTGDINQWAAGDAADSVYSINDADFMNKMLDNGLQISGDDKTFHFYHLEGAHTPYVLNEKAEYIDSQTSRYEQVKGCFYIVKTFMSQMKQLGIYNDSTILIIADHGDIGVGERPLLLVKPSGINEEYLKESTAPTIDSDYQTTIEISEDLIDSDAGVNIFDIKEDEARERYKYGKINTGEAVYGQVLKEYLVLNDARDKNNWKETGNDVTMKTELYEFAH